MVTQLTVEAIILLAVIVFLVAGYSWWHYVRSNPKRVYWGMVSNLLATTSGEEHVSQAATGQKLDQQITFQTTGQQLAHSITTISQGADNTSVTTEGIGTPYLDYVRYIAIHTAQKGSNGKAFNFSSLLNIWGKNDNPTPQTTGQLYNQVVLGVIPFADLNVSQRQELLRLMTNVYSASFTTVERQLDHHRPTYVYNVSVNPQAYITMIKRYASMVGLTQLNQLNPANYQNAPQLQFQATVDVWSRQLKSINYPSSNRLEQFGAWGEPMRPVNLPRQTIPINDLQNKLQTLQQ